MQSTCQLEFQDVIGIVFLIYIDAHFKLHIKEHVTQIWNVLGWYMFNLIKCGLLTYIPVQ